MIDYFIVENILNVAANLDTNWTRKHCLYIPEFVHLEENNRHYGYLLIDLQGSL